MSGDPPIIASAVVVPEQADAAPAPALSPTVGNRKRRQHSQSPPPDDGKRARLELRRPSTVTTGDRERGKRLFGGVFSKMGQGTKVTARTEAAKQQAERKLAEKRRLEAEEEEQKKNEGLDTLYDQAQRDSADAVYDSQQQRLAMEDALNKTRSLTTVSEPMLYYQPAELTAEQDERVKQQIAEKEDSIKKNERQRRVIEDEYVSQEQLEARANGTGMVVDVKGEDGVEKPDPVGSSHSDNNAKLHDSGENADATNATDKVNGNVKEEVEENHEQEHEDGVVEMAGEDELVY